MNTATGAVSEAATVLALPGVGVPFEFTRAYTSIDQTDGPLGKSWTHPYNASLTFDGA